MKTYGVPGGLIGWPGACSSGADRLDVFAVGPGGNTVWRMAFDGSADTGPTPLPPNGTIPAVAVCAESSGLGRVEVFAVEQSQRAPVWWRGTNGQFQVGPRPIAGGPNMPAVPVAAVCATPEHIDLFGAGAGNTPWWWHWSGASWSSPQPLPTGANIPAVGVAAVSPRPDRLDVFAVGANNHLWHWTKSPQTGGWVQRDLGGNLPAEGVSSVSWGTDRIDVFAASREPGNPLWHWWSNGAGFASESLGGTLVQGSVSAVSHAANRLDVFGITPGRQLARWTWNGQRWSGPALLGDSLPAGDVSAVVRTPHKLDVFALGNSGTLRRWPGGGLENATAQPWRNWPTNRTVNPVAGHLSPDSLDELVNIVTEAERLGRGVRAVGSSWSNSDVAVSPAYVVETDRLNSEITDVLDTCLNPTGAGLRLVHVEAGIKLDGLNRLLDQRGLALPTMGGSSGQSLAGVVSTSARGMDIDRGPIPDMVRAIHLVGPGGAQHWVEPTKGITDRVALRTALGLADANIHFDDDWFNSVLVSMGAMGIIYSLVIEVVPQHDLVEAREALAWSTMKARLKGGAPNPFSGNRGVQVVVNPYPARDGSRACYLTTRRQAAPTGPRPTADNSMLVGLISPAMIAMFNADRGTIDETVTWLTSQGQPIPAGRPGWAHTVMGGPNPGPVRGLTVGALFDATNDKYLDFVDAALQMLSDAYDKDSHRYGYLGWISLRYQGPSRAYMSPFQKAARTCFIEFAAFGSIPEIGVSWGDTPVLMELIENLCRQHGGALHWGLNNSVNAADVARAYPRLETWRRVRYELTRSGALTTFDNVFTRRCGLSNPPMLARAAAFGQNGCAVPVIWRPSTGTWWIKDFFTGAERAQQWGLPGDIPVPGDYTGDGRTDFAIWRPVDGTWWILDAATGTPRVQQWGEAGDIPVPGDYSGDGRTDFAVWRPATGTWWIRDNASGTSRTQQWGQQGDIPVTGDYDGDGRTDFAVWRPSTGTWWIIDSSTGAGRSRQYGDPGDIPVPADYSGDGRTDFAVWRPSTGTWWIIDSSSGVERSQQYGNPGDIPVPGRFDTDKRTDFAIWRPSTGTWWIMNSSTGVERSQQWGDPGDVVV